MAESLAKCVRADALAFPTGWRSTTGFQRNPLALLAQVKLLRESDPNRLGNLLCSEGVGACLRNAFDTATAALAGSFTLHAVRSPRCEPKFGAETTRIAALLEARFAMLTALESAVQTAALETRVNFKLLSLCVALSQLRLRTTHAYRA